MFIKIIKISSASCFYPLLTEQSCGEEEEEEKEDKFVFLQTHAARDLNILNWLLRYNNSINKKVTQPVRQQEHIALVVTLWKKPSLFSYLLLFHFFSFLFFNNIQE